VGDRENIFIASTQSVSAEAALLAELLGLEFMANQPWPGVQIGLRSPARTVDGWLGYVVQENTLVEHDDPEYRQAIDTYPIDLTVWYGSRSIEVQRREARLVFDMLAERRPDTAMLLCHKIDHLLAAYLPEDGAYDFPPETSMDLPHVERWQPWVV
jgi:hypothetical protein